MSLIDLHPQDRIFFLATLHKRVREPYTYSQWNSGCPNSDGRLDFGCEIFVPFQVCIPHDGLTCDYLPNCAQTVSYRSVFERLIWSTWQILNAFMAPQIKRPEKLLRSSTSFLHGHLRNPKAWNEFSWYIWVSVEAYNSEWIEYKHSFVP